MPTPSRLLKSPITWFFAGLLCLVAALLVPLTPALAQTLSFDFGDAGASVSVRIVQLLVLLTILSLAPGVLVMVTSFTRIVVVLSFLRSALGVQQTPPNIVIVSLALFLTGFVMAPTFERAWQEGVLPYSNNELSEDQAFERSVEPFRTFMLSQTREQDLQLFIDLGDLEDPPVDSADLPLTIIIPAFMIGELRRAFEIGFLLFIPFVVIDMAVASVLMAMGMLMLPPVFVSLPFKIIFFVVVDGWYILSGSLVRGFETPGLGG